MKYNLDWIYEEAQSNKQIKYLFFWGHQPSKDGSITSSCLSQWWLCEFVVDDILYKSAEHWMMAEKARLFQDNEILEKIINCQSPAEAKKLGRQVRNFEVEKWNEARYEIVKKGNHFKFEQNVEMKTFLRNTKNRVLVEASPVDPIWGIGLAKDNRKSQYPNQWKGLNLLGFALMEVREELT
ncbi:MAG: NADAR family protein [Saprospiraceae bacterium]